MAGTLVVSGFKEVVQATAYLIPSERAAAREAFTKVGEIVRGDAYPRLAKYSTRSAQGLKVRVRQRGVAVEQSLRKTTGLHPEYGALQMRKALLPALYRSQPEIVAEFDKALDTVVATFNR